MEHVPPAKYAAALKQSETILLDAIKRKDADPIQRNAYAVRSSDKYKWFLDHKKLLLEYEDVQVKFIVEKAERYPTCPYTAKEKVHVMATYKSMLADHKAMLAVIYEMPAFEALLELVPDKANALQTVYDSMLEFVIEPKLGDADLLKSAGC